MKKRIIFLWIIGCILVIVLFFYFSYAPKPVEERVKIGALIPLSGAGAIFGEDIRNGIVLAAEENTDIEIIYEDTRSEAVTAVNSANKLITINNVKYLVSWMSSPSAAIAPIADENKVILLYSSTINEPAEKYEYVFKNYINIEKDCEILANKLQGKKGRLIGINQESTLACIKGFKNGGMDLQEELYEKGETDFKTNLIKIKSSEPDFVVIRLFPTETDIILKQMKELGFKDIQLICPHLSVPLCNSEEIIKKYEFLFIDALGTDFHFDKNNEHLMSFYEKYQQKFKKEPLADAIYAYENIMILSKAIKLCESNVECVKQQLREKTFDGLDGDLKFNEKGVVERKTTILEFNNGQWAAE